MNLLPFLWSELRKKRQKNDDGLIIKGIWDMELFFKPNLQERLFHYNVILSLITHHGCCYSLERAKIHNIKELIGKNIFDIPIPLIRRDIAISLLDAAFANYSILPTYSKILNGLPTKKANKRAEIICNEIKRNIVNNKDINIGIIGSVGSIINEVQRNGWKCRTSDMDRYLINKKLNKITIENANKNEEIIKNSNFIIVTGMTAYTDTLIDIIQWKKKYKSYMILFAETGSNFSEIYTKIGIDVVISEPFPFYIFNTKNKINVYRR